jgi:hypothetical protein
MENLRQDDVRDKPYGEGTSDNPYKISSAENLIYMAEHEEYWDDKYFRQTNNIDLSGIDWTPINNGGISTSINYNGNNYTISNLTINSSNLIYVGLFGALQDNSIISNLIIENYNIINTNPTNGTVYIGSIVGYTNYGISIINCTVLNGSIISDTGKSPYIGGIAGRSEGATILNCIVKDSTLFSNDYTRNSRVGGIIGLGSGNIDNCVSIRNSIRGARCGGIVGSMSSTVGLYNNITNCYSTSTIYSTTYPYGGGAGGVIGSAASLNTTITNCYSNGLVINNGNNQVGGFVGYQGGSYPPIINNCYWDMETSGQPTSAGGIGKTSAQLAQQSTFIGWDFTDIWEMDTSYPTLRFEKDVITKETGGFEYAFEYPIINELI